MKRPHRLQYQMLVCTQASVTAFSSKDTKIKDQETRKYLVTPLRMKIVLGINIEKQNRTETEASQPTRQRLEVTENKGS